MAFTYQNMMNVHLIFLAIFPSFIISLKFDNIKIYSEQIEELTR